MKSRYDRNILQNAINTINNQIIENFSEAEIINNQNEIIANLTSNYNKKAKLYNSQIDLIGQNERIVEDHNNKLNRQLDDLAEIQDKIMWPDISRLIRKYKPFLKFDKERFYAIFRRRVGHNNTEDSNS